LQFDPIPDRYQFVLRALAAPKRAARVTMKTNGFSSGAAHAARRRDDEPTARLRDSSSLDVSGGVPDSARGVDAAPGVADMSEVQVEDGKRCAACNENGITKSRAMDSSYFDYCSSFS